MSLVISAVERKGIILWAPCKDHNRDFMILQVQSSAVISLILNFSGYACVYNRWGGRIDRNGSHSLDLVSGRTIRLRSRGGFRQSCRSHTDGRDNGAVRGARIGGYREHGRI